MTDPEHDPIDAPPTRVVVVGGGLAGLVAARDLARPGFDVTLLEASGELGGTVRAGELAGIRVDVGAESFATRGTAVSELLGELGLADARVSPRAGGAWLRLADRTVPLPAAGLLGIPSVPLARDVAAAIGWGGALRAWLDRVLPVLTIGQERSLGRLVARRMGRRVLTDLVEPVAGGVYSADPLDLDVAVVAPGLSRELTKAGTLSGAVGALRARAPAGSAVAGIAGGVARLTEELAADARRRGARLETGVAVTGIRPREGSASPDAPRWRVAAEDGRELEADAVVVATEGPAALRLLATAGGALAHVAGLAWPSASSVELVTLVVDDARLDAAPRGTGVLVASSARSARGAASSGPDRTSARDDRARTAAGPVVAKALTHATAKWSWLAHEAGEHRHVIRLSYGSAGAAPATQGLDDGVVRELALADASALLGIPLADADVAGMLRTPWTNALPFAASGQRERVAALTEELERAEGLEAAGAWLSGTGIASVVPSARAAAARTRALRWRLFTGSGHAETSGSDDDRTESA